MNRIVTVAPVRKSISVAAAPDRAFHVFTAGMSRWWIKNHSINKSPIKDIVIEPRAGGRWYERGEDGSTCDWGRVLSWEPPTRLLLSWEITADWISTGRVVTRCAASSTRRWAGRVSSPRSPPAPRQSREDQTHDQHRTFAHQ